MNFGTRALLSVSDAHVAYGKVEAVRAVSLAVADNEIVTIIGANGAGKTTLLKAIMGLIAATGRAELRGRSLLGEPAHRRVALGIGYVPEGRRGFPFLTVEENLRLGAFASKVNIAEGLAAQYEQFPVLGDRRKKYCATLSGGERQMLAMARALIAQPRVLLLDEPSLGLAPQVTSGLMKTILQLCESKNLTVILVEQNAKSALRIAHTAVVLHLGTVVASDDADKVASDDDLRRYYLGLVQ